MEQLIKFNTLEGEKEIDLYSIISEDDTFVPKKTTKRVVKYDGCKKLAAYFKLVIKETPLFFSQPNSENKQQHVWCMRMGFKGDQDRDNRTFAEGEASQFNTKPINKGADGNPILNKDNIDAQFKSNMAYKRAYCRGVFKHLGMLGVYADIESPSFYEGENGTLDIQQL